MRGKVAKLLRKQSELTGLPIRGLKKLWNSGAVSSKEKVKWRKIIEAQAKESENSTSVQGRYPELLGTETAQQEVGEGVLDRTAPRTHGLPKVGE